MLDEKKLQANSGINESIRKLDDEQEQIKSRVKVLERIVTDLRVEVDELKKAQ